MEAAAADAVAGCRGAAWSLTAGTPGSWWSSWWSPPTEEAARGEGTGRREHHSLARCGGGDGAACGAGWRHGRREHELGEEAERWRGRGRGTWPAARLMAGDDGSGQRPRLGSLPRSRRGRRGPSKQMAARGTLAAGSCARWIGRSGASEGREERREVERGCWAATRLSSRRVKRRGRQGLSGLREGIERDGF